LFALSNGHIGIRGNLDEGEPYGLPGTYLNGFYESRPLPSAETQYGAPEYSQTMINVTNGKLFRLLVDDEPFDVRQGHLQLHDRALDFRTGTLKRTLEWRSPAGRTVRVTSVRLVSFTHRAIVGILYEVEPLDARAYIAVQSELVANEQLPSSVKDPRVAAVIESPLISEEYQAHGAGALLVHRTRQSGLRMAAAMDHEITGTPQLKIVTQVYPDSARVVATDVLRPGEKLRILKFVAYGWSQERSRAALRDQVAVALLAARNSGWDTLIEEKRKYLDDFWLTADVELEGDPELQQAVRFAIFQVLSNVARAEGRAIPGKGLTGSGYDGHTFWDMDLYLVIMLTCIAPKAAADALRWRHSTLDIARAHARELGRAGAAFPWRTIRGEECSGYWPAGTAAFHINADVAFSVLNYVMVTGDSAFEHDVGIDILVETARFWRSLGHFELDGEFRIDGVTGPDEYSAIADNNVYTNLMAQQNLRAAAEACQRHQDKKEDLGVSEEEMANWRAAADRMRIPYDERLGIHPQADGFTRHEKWDFAHTRPDQYPLMLHFPYYELYRKQVVKQSDLVLAMLICPFAFTPEQKVRNFEYYERITVRDSSLSAAIQACAAADGGHLRLAFDYAAEAALTDLHDLHHNVRDGLHMASLAGALIAFVFGFGGLRNCGDHLGLSPRLPDGLTRLVFSMLYRGIGIRVDISTHSAKYSLIRGQGSVHIEHHGEPLDITSPEPVERPIPPTTNRPEPTQPPGREPQRRSPAGIVPIKSTRVA
jgi:alpha,alpha-trehalose phosphorylase